MIDMSTINNQETVKIKHQIKSGYGLLLSSLLWAGLGFIVVGLLSIGYSFLIRNNFQAWLDSQAYTIGSAIVLVVFVAISAFINIKWSTNVTNSSWTLIVFVWIIDVLLMTGMIAPLVTLIDNPWLVFIVIAISGGIFVLMAILGYCVLTYKTAITLSKLIWFIFGGLLVFNLIFMLTFSFLYTNAYSVFYLVFDVCYLVISLLSIAMTFFNISKSEQFSNDIDRQQKLKLGLFFGLQLLMSYIVLFVTLLRIIIRFKN